MSAPDPHQVVTDAVSAGGFDPEAQLATRILEALCEAGWRLVRTDPCTDPYALIGRCGCHDITITEEYEIAATPARGKPDAPPASGLPGGDDGEGVTVP